MVNKNTSLPLTITGREARIIRCKNLALYIGDCESLVTG